MDKILAPLLTAFGLAVSLWSAGVAIMLPILVKCLIEGWQHFTLDEYQTVALAAVIAGPVALILRLCGYQPRGAEPPSEAPPAAAKEPS